MSNTNHTLPTDQEIDLVITAVEIRDPFDHRENLNLRLEAVGNTDRDPQKIVYVRMNMICEKMNGAYNSVCIAAPKFRLATKDMTAKQVRHYIHKSLRDPEFDKWGLIGTVVGCRILEGRNAPDGSNYPDTVFINSIKHDNLADNELEEMLNTTDYFAPAPTTGSSVGEIEEALAS